jgi:glycosyltransferase involved in cell wall biosynthesis
LNVLHLIPRLIGGGPEQSVLALAAETAALGVAHRHTLAVLDTPVAPRMVAAARRRGVGVAIRLDLPALHRLVAQADIVQIHYWNHPLLLALLRQTEFPPARIVLCARVLGTEAPQVLTAEIGRFADHLVLTSELSRDTAGARAAAAAGKPVTVIPGISDMGRLDGFVREPHPGCVVGYLGAVNDAKMHPRFPEMAAAVADPSVRFLICGGGGGEDRLRRRLHALGLAERAEVTGYVTDVRAALQRMDVFGYPLTPQTYATSEKALQEAMWVGIPPVVFPHGGVRLLVEHERTGLVAATEAAYVAAIERLAADTALRHRLGAEARRFARRNFDPAAWTRATVALFEDAASTPRRNRARLHAGVETAAAGFVAALDDRAGPFALSLAGCRSVDADAIAAADRAIARSSVLLAHGEGGIIHYRNAAPHDPHLRLWSGLLAEAAHDFALADREFEAAERCGMTDDRAAHYRRRARGW